VGEQTLPSAAQFLTQQRDWPPVSGWHTPPGAHWPASHRKPTGGCALQPAPAVQPLPHIWVTTSPPLQVRCVLPSHSTCAPSQRTQPVPALLQNRPAPHAPAQHTRSPPAVATQASDVQSLSWVQLTPAAKAQAPDAGSQTHWVSGRRPVKNSDEPHSSALRHCPNERHRFSVMASV
jgi:hypothetical protein